MNGYTLNEIPYSKRQVGSLHISSRTRLCDTLQKMLGKLSIHSIASFNDLFVMPLCVDVLAKIHVEAIYIHE